MEKHLNLDSFHAIDFVDKQEIENIQTDITKARKMLENRNGPGGEFTGWLNLPDKFDKDELDQIIEAAKKIRKQSKILVVIGIGGSYLGAKAAIEMLSSYFTKKRRLEVIFAGHNMSAQYLSELTDYLQGKDFSINVISKSGMTTEPAIAFRVLKKLIEKKYGHEAKNRIYVTTDPKKGELRNIAIKEGYETFVIPSDIGGRYSVLTAAGLLPIAAAGFNIKQIIRGAKASRRAYKKMGIWENDAHLYAALRNLLYRKGYQIEMLINYEPKLLSFSEWWKQLFAESEGKDHKGLFTASASFSTDLHSLGQYIQDGKRILFETVIQIEKSKSDIIIEPNAENLEELNYLKGLSLDFINKKAFQGTLIAHEIGKVPNLVITIPEINEYLVGYLFYYFQLACAVSGYVLEVNPFDQPGVDAYKNNMYALLGKPGYEKLRSELENKLAKKNNHQG
ncbi:MAG: glucose-6-phosphate isomerase [Candidatus Izemoplasmatales bacterium]|jgi:glucose-6-phosphate isomerase